jgi:DNA-binding NarL/FixJ family response regulator
MIGINKSSVTVNTSNFHIKERQRQVASLLARGKNETEIAKEHNVSQPTVSNDINALKEMSLQFVFDLAKSDLGYYY